jgi:hypothetical protein
MIQIHCFLRLVAFEIMHAVELTAFSVPADVLSRKLNKTTMPLQRNIEVRSRTLCCYVEAIIITYSECWLSQLIFCPKN